MNNCGLTVNYSQLFNYNYMPVNFMAAVVAFFKGWENQAESKNDEKFYSMEVPPNKPKRPFGAPDYTGKKAGQFTALYWLTNKPGQIMKSLWVCQCSCGRYQLLRPSTWKESKNYNFFACDKCVSERKKHNSKSIRQKRLLNFVDKMQKKGIDNISLLKLLIISYECKKGIDVDDYNVNDLQKIIFLEFKKINRNGLNGYLLNGDVNEL